MTYKNHAKAVKIVKMAEKSQKNAFFVRKYLIFTKNVVTLSEIFRKIPGKYIKRLII